MALGKRWHPYPTLLLVIAVLSASCGSEGDSRTLIDEQLGPEGGLLQTIDDAVRVEAPVAALQHPVQVRVVRSADNTGLPSGFVAGTQIEVDSKGQGLTKPISLTVSYPGSLPQADAKWLRLVRVLPDGTLGPTELQSHDSDRHRVTARTSVLGRFVLVDSRKAGLIAETMQRSAGQVDVVFVMDTSGSAEKFQRPVIDSFGRFSAALDQSALHYRIGVISSDLGAGPYSGFDSCWIPGGDGAILQHRARVEGCQPPDDAWIEKRDGWSNVGQDDVAQAFGCIAKLGDQGCGFEQPLEAVRRALDPKVNPRFVREDAALAIVMVTNEDDCSAEDTSIFAPWDGGLNGKLGPLTSFRCFEFGMECDVAGRAYGPRADCRSKADGPLFPLQRYRTRLKEAKRGRPVTVAAITGGVGPVEVKPRRHPDNPRPVLAPSCRGDTIEAFPAVRLGQFVDTFGASGLQRSICEDDFGSVLADIGQQVVDGAFSWCLPYQAVDVNPLSDALEADCSVVVEGIGDVDACTETASQPCYRVAIGASNCEPNESLLTLHHVPATKARETVDVACLVADKFAPND